VSAGEGRDGQSIFRRPEVPTLVIGLGSVSMLVLKAICEFVGGRDAIHDHPLVLAHLDTSPLSRDDLEALPAGCAVRMADVDLASMSDQRAAYPELAALWTGDYRPSHGGGAGGIPLHGRLLAQRTPLRGHLERFVDTLLKKAGEHPDSPEVEVCLIGSTAGGTFSGSEYYVAALVDSVMLAKGHPKYKLASFVFLPELFPAGGRVDWFDAITWSFLERSRLLFAQPHLEDPRNPYPQRLSPIFLVGKGSSGIMLRVESAMRVLARYVLTRASKLGLRLEAEEDNVLAPARHLRFATPEFGVLVAERARIAAAMASLQLPGFLRHLVHERRPRDEVDQVLARALAEVRLDQGQGATQEQVFAEALLQALGDGASVPPPPLALGASIADMNQYERTLEDRRDRAKEQVQRNAATCLARLRTLRDLVAAASGEYPADDGPAARLADLLHAALGHLQQQLDRLQRTPDTLAQSRQDWQRHAANPKRRLALQNLHAGAVQTQREREVRMEALHQALHLLHEAREQAQSLRDDIRRRAAALARRAAELDEGEVERQLVRQIERERTGEELVRFALTPGQLVAAAREALPGGDWLPAPGVPLHAERAERLERVRAGLRGCPLDPEGQRLLERLHASIVAAIDAPLVAGRNLAEWLLQRPEGEWHGEIVDLFRRQVHPLLAVDLSAPGAQQEERLVVGYAPPRDPQAAAALMEEIQGQIRGEAKIQTVALDDPEVLVVIGGVYRLQPAQVPNAANLERRCGEARARFAASPQDAATARITPCPDATGVLYEALAQLGAQVPQPPTAG
jgi:hypothetical protein